MDPESFYWCELCMQDPERQPFANYAVQFTEEEQLIRHLREVHQLEIHKPRSD